MNNEDEIVLYCARTDIEVVEEQIFSLINDNLDWQYLLYTASRHGLMPLLYTNLNLICPEKIPPEIMIELSDFFRANLRKNLLLTKDLDKILEILRSKGFESIPYKGPVLANIAYGNLSLREFGDIDILIDRSDAVKVKNAIISNGYELYRPIEINDDSYLKLEPEYIFLNKNTGTILEAKWKIEGNFISFPKNTKIVSDKLVRLDVNGITMDTFSIVDHLLILCIHAAKHDWNRLLLVCDISELIKSEEDIDWVEIFEKAEKLKIKRILFINLILARDLFNLEVNETILDYLNQDSYALNISNQLKEKFFNEYPLNVFEKLILDLNKREKFFYGFKDCVNGLTNPTYVDYKEIPLPHYLFILYFFIRPFLLLRRYCKDPI